MKKILSTLILIFIGYQGVAQCSVGEAEVRVVVNTDTYGFEGYWQIVPSGNNCGVGFVAEGGNLLVGCYGGGAQSQFPGGYLNNQQIIEGPYCLPIGNKYDLIYVDDFGDGGFDFAITINGFQIGSYIGTGIGGKYSFTVNEPKPYDLSIKSSNLNPYIKVGGYNLEANVFNNGSKNTTDFDLNYSIDGGAPIKHAQAGLNVQNFESTNIKHGIPLSFPSIGFYTIKVWADNINNGNSDANTSNDTMTVLVEAGLGTPNNIDDYIGAVTTIKQIAGASNLINLPTDLDFHPTLSNNELWVINKGTENSGGSSVTIFDAGELSQTTSYKKDANAWHFMSLPTALAFSDNGNWATAPGVYDANHDGGGAFTGPSLWSSDFKIHAQPSGGNGSHLDMLHASPYSQGIAAEKNNVFWLFDGFNKDIVRYDFAEDHGPGNSFHGDAIIRRYSEDKLERDPSGKIVSHLVLDENKQWLYAVDHGNQRVIRIDINTGSNLGNSPLYSPNEAVVEYSTFNGYTQETVINELDKPSGIDVVGDRMIVSEHQTGEIIIFDISSMPAIEISRIQTGFSTVQGLKIGPDGNIWFVDESSHGVYTIEITSLATVNENNLEISIYPNPVAGGQINITTNQFVDGRVELRNVGGQLISIGQLKGQNLNFKINDIAVGLYFLTVVKDNEVLFKEKLIVK